MTKSLAEMETVFRALADQTRLRILGLLLTGEVCVCHIHDSLRISQPKASRHLAYLRRAGLVATRREGLWIHYRMATLPDAVPGNGPQHGGARVDTRGDGAKGRRAAAEAHRLPRAWRRRLLRVLHARRKANRGHEGQPLIPDVTIDRAMPEDVAAMLELLRGNALPLDGLLDHLPTALVARSLGRVVGVAALEVYDDGALLRSVTVDATLRGHGVGNRLTAAALDLAGTLRLPAVYLLTTTAEGYFPRFAFSRISRDEVPPGVQQSVEFRSACPASAVVMKRAT